MPVNLGDIIDKVKKDFVPFDLTLAGGGAKGIVQLGALQELKEQGYSFRKLVGTSAGAISCTLLSVGYSPDEILEAITEKMPNGQPRMTTFLDVPSADDVKREYQDEVGEKDKQQISKILDKKLKQSLLKSNSYRQLLSFIEFGGIYKGQAFVEWMQEKLNRKNLQLGKATLSELYEATHVDLTIVASDITKKVMLALNYRTAPDVPVAWAVRMSMSIPFLWHEVVWREEWGTYLGEEIQGHSIVDGGVISNFPLELLLSKSKVISKIMGTSSNPSRVIGLLIDTNLPVPGSEGTKPKSSTKNQLTTDKSWTAVLDRFTNMFDTMMRGHDNLVCAAYPDRVCLLPAKGYDTMEFDMSDERIELLVQAGGKAMADFLLSKE